MRRGLPFELFLGLRYLRSRGQRTNLSLFVWIGLGGVFLGVAALIVVLAVMTGFQDGIRDRIIAGKPAPADLPERRARGSTTAERVAGRVQASGASARPRRSSTSRRSSRRAGRRRARRPDPRRRPRDPGGPAGRPVAAAPGQSRAARGRRSPRSCSARELARTLGVFTGDSVTVISPEGAITAVGMVPKMRRYTVAGTIEIGMHEYDSLDRLPEPAGGQGVRRARRRHRNRGQAHGSVRRQGASAERWPRRWASASGCATGWR